MQAAYDRNLRSFVTCTRQYFRVDAENAIATPAGRGGFARIESVTWLGWWIMFICSASDWSTENGTIVFDAEILHVRAKLDSRTTALSDVECNPR